jgi:hypothetical protein
MEKRKNDNDNGQTRLKDLAVVTLVNDMDDAREYEMLLRLNDIPAVVKEQFDASGDNSGIAILVPEDCLDEAHVVIESQNAYDDFYDFSDEEMDDEDGLEFDDDFDDDDL